MWIAFEPGTFSEYYVISDSSPTVGDKFLALGYGPAPAGLPTLRYGFNTIQSYGNVGALVGEFISSAQASFNQVSSFDPPFTTQAYCDILVRVTN
jgi:hypothetical protein